jgi:hypothetical protein
VISLGRQNRNKKKQALNGFTLCTRIRASMIRPAKSLPRQRCSWQRNITITSSATIKAVILQLNHSSHAVSTLSTYYCCGQRYFGNIPPNAILLQSIMGPARHRQMGRNPVRMLSGASKTGPSHWDVSLRQLCRQHSFQEMQEMLAKIYQETHDILAVQTFRSILSHTLHPSKTKTCQ